MLLIFLVNLTNAQTVVFNTVTGHATGGSAGSQVILPPVSVPTGTIVNVNNGWNGSMITSIGETGSNYYAQAFIANVASITKIGIVIQEFSSEGQVKFGIAADNGGVPNYAAPLFMGTLINPTTTAQWYYEEGLDIPVIVGQKYYILIDGYDNAGATGYSGIGYSNTQPITGEGIIWSNFGGVGSWDSMSNYPLAIYVEGTTAPVPVPIWAIILAFGVIGITTLISVKRKMVKQAI